MDSLAEGIAALRAGRADDAVRLFRLAAAAAPHDSRPQHNLGSVLLYELKRPAEAEAAYRVAIARNPTDAAHHMGLGYALQTPGRFAEAEIAFREALRLQPTHPDVKTAIAFQLLAQGRLAEGFELFEHRKKPDASSAFTIPEWNGEPLAGKRLLIWREQGFGDQIQMARFLPLLPRDEARITYAGYAEIAPLITQVPGIAFETAIDTRDFDYWTSPMSFPHRLGVNERTLPTAPYLTGRARGSGGVGVMWRGNATPDPDRSLPESLAGAVMSLPGAISLAPEDTGATTFQDTADIIAGLDAVVTIDTAVAHLAGAMGKPTHIMLPALVRDWRWGDTGPQPLVPDRPALPPAHPRRLAARAGRGPAGFDTPHLGLQPRHAVMRSNPRPDGLVTE